MSSCPISTTRTTTVIHACMMLMIMLYIWNITRVVSCDDPLYAAPVEKDAKEEENGEEEEDEDEDENEEEYEYEEEEEDSGESVMRY